MSNVIPFKRGTSPITVEEVIAHPTVSKHKSHTTKAEPGKAPVFVDMASIYTCTRCNAERFKINFEGLIVCDECDALMRNIQALAIKA